MMVKRTLITGIFSLLLLLTVKVEAQVEYQWLSIGDLHNYYGNIGMEIESGFIDRQQAGMQWPAIYDRQDMQAAKGMWLGATNVVDENGNNFSTRVIHVGPRATGIGYFYPTEFAVISRYEDPSVLAEGIPSYEKQADISEIEPGLLSDRAIVNTVNTALGVTMERTIYAYSNPYHDNYHIISLTFTNTGNTDGDEDIELPNNTVNNFVVYLQNRWSVSRRTRHTIGNSTGWGFNAMTDRRGDGRNSSGQPSENDFKASFTWHGLLPGFQVPGAPNDFDNIGGPIWVPSSDDGLSSTDTTGRLGSYQFIGRLHLSAPEGTDENGNSVAQPMTMSEIGSDDALNFQNDPFNLTKMQEEYAKMTEGLSGNPARHAYRVEPSGRQGFLDPSNDPSLGTSGGWSAATGYGPYDLAPGESITIVYAEAAAGISKELANSTGRNYKQLGTAFTNPETGSTGNLAKNEIVFQGLDSLFMTFERIQDNWNNNAGDIVDAPRPPSSFEVKGGGDGIFLDWQYPVEALGDISGFEIYRSEYSKDSTDVLIGEVDVNDDNGQGEYSFIDDNFTTDPDGNPIPPIRGRDYFYYVTAISANEFYTGVQPSNYAADGDLYPDDKLRSSRYYTQTYNGATLKRPPGEDMSEIAIAPNPYIASSSDQLRFIPGVGADRIAFFDIPGRCDIEIYTELGERITTLKHRDGSGDEYWDLRTDARQRIVSGLYIAVIKNLDTGEQAIKKFVVVL